MKSQDVFFEGITKEGTKRMYMAAMRSYLDYTKTPSELTAEAVEDSKRDIKTNIVKRQLIGFYNYPITDAEVKNTNGTVIKGRHHTSEAARRRVLAISLFGNFLLYLDFNNS